MTAFIGRREFITLLGGQNPSSPATRGLAGPCVLISIRAYHGPKLVTTNAELPRK